MKINGKFDVSNYEYLVSYTDQLIGGFSSSIAYNVENEDNSGTTNNCSGGNCTSSCGTGQNIQCNAVAHCGT